MDKEMCESKGAKKKYVKKRKVCILLLISYLTSIVLILCLSFYKNQYKFIKI